MTESEKIEVAIHEAGHAVIAIKNKLWVDRVSLDPGYCLAYPLGYFDIPEIYEESDRLSEYKRATAASILGAPLAVRKFRQGVLMRDMSWDEFKEATLAEQMYIARLHESKIVPFNVRNDLEFDEYLASEFEPTRRAVLKYWREIQGVAAALLTFGELNESQVSTVLKNVGKIYNVDFLNFQEPPIPVNGATAEEFKATL